MLPFRIIISLKFYDFLFQTRRWSFGLFKVIMSYDSYDLSHYVLWFLWLKSLRLVIRMLTLNLNVTYFSVMILVFRNSLLLTLRSFKLFFQFYCGIFIEPPSAINVPDLLWSDQNWPTLEVYTMGILLCTTSSNTEGYTQLYRWMYTSPWCPIYDSTKNTSTWSPSQVYLKA